MEDSDEVPDEFEEVMISPTGTNVTAGNDIIELDAHVNDAAGPMPPDKQPDISEETLAVVADELADLDAHEASARVEIERRHLVQSPEHILRFTAERLTRIMVMLSVATTRAKYQNEFDTRHALTAFGHFVEVSTDSPMDGSVGEVSIPNLEPQRGDYIDPFKVVANHQQLIFTDEEDEPISTGSEMDLTGTIDY